MDDDELDYELARRARDGDREALAALLERTRMWLFRGAYAALGHYEDAQDVVASTVFQICRHIGRLREPERARAWMGAVLRNEIRRHGRRAGGRPVALADEAESDPA